MKDAQGRFHAIKGAPDHLADALEFTRDVARVVDGIDDVRPDDAIYGINDVHTELVEKMLLQRSLMAQSLLQADGVFVKIVRTRGIAKTGEFRGRTRLRRCRVGFKYFLVVQVEGCVGGIRERLGFGHLGDIRNDRLWLVVRLEAGFV